VAEWVKMFLSGEMAIGKREEHKKNASIAFDKIKEHLKKCDE
jgi:hypothetical protein